jgi:hypothetical protein
MAEHDRRDPPGLAVPLGLALAQLPLEAPARDAWPLLAARLRAKRRAPRWPLALAASLLLGLLLLPRMTGVPESSTLAASRAANGNAAATPEAQLAALMTESAGLERLLAAAATDAGAGSASAMALGLAYEDQLHSLDAELAANTDPSRTLPLWRQRVELLRGVAAVETSRRYVAAQGGNFDVALVAAY